MFKYEERTVVHGHNEAIDMFCNMLEIVSSAHINKKACTEMLDAIPTDLLHHFRAGIITITNWTDDILRERNACLSDDELMVKRANECKAHCDDNIH